jgi:hypothetical protein
MARIVAGFSEEALRVLVREGRFGDPLLENELGRVLVGRRARILQRYLTRLSALTRPEIRRGTQRELCVRDLAWSSGLRGERERRYAVTAYADRAPPTRLDDLRQAFGQRVCATLPEQPGASAQAPGYLIVDWVAQTEQHTAEFPARVHLYDLGPDGVRIVGLERPESFAPPR